jgi:hypothetical protein
MTTFPVIFDDQTDQYDAKVQGIFMKQPESSEPG